MHTLFNLIASYADFDTLIDLGALAVCGVLIVGAAATGAFREKGDY